MCPVSPSWYGQASCFLTGVSTPLSREHPCPQLHVQPSTNFTCSDVICRQGAQAKQGAREGPEAWAPGVFSINCVVRGWGSPGHSRWTWGPQLPFPRSLDPRCLPSLCLWRQACEGISQLLPQAFSLGIRPT